MIENKLELLKFLSNQKSGSSFVTSLARDK